MYVLDTNAAYYLGDPARTSAQQLARLHEKAGAKQFRVGVPPITVLELASRIVEDPTWFDRIKAIAKAVINLRPASLPDPEQRMREITEGVSLARQSHEHWLQILDTIARAPDASALQRGFDDCATATRRSANVVHLARYRDDYERQYAKDMLTLVRSINPKYDEQVLKGKDAKLPVSEQRALRAFFATGEWIAIFVTMLASRGGTGIVPTDAGKLGVALEKAKFFRLAYEALCISMFCDGARPSLKRKNDYNDIHQLLLVNDLSADVLVSDDAGPLTKVGGPTGKVIPFDDFLAREAV